MDHPRHSGDAQTANLVFLWVHATAARWQQAFHFVPPLFAFFVGVVISDRAPVGWQQDWSNPSRH